MNFEEQIAQTLLKKIVQIAEERHLNEEEIKNLMDISVGAALTDGIRAMSDGMVSRLIQQIPEMIKQERELQVAFEQRLYARWSNALDLFDATVILTREAGERFLQKHRNPPTKEEKMLLEALVRTHVQACQTASAIGVLLKSGFARDALARQRILHELAVVASLLKKYGPSLAERFLAHETIETCAAAEQYEQSYLRLGLEPPDPEKSYKTPGRAHTPVSAIWRGLQKQLRMGCADCCQIKAPNIQGFGGSCWPRSFTPILPYGRLWHPCNCKGHGV